MGPLNRSMFWVMHLRIRMARRIFRTSLVTSIASWLGLCAAHRGFNLASPALAPLLDRALLIFFLTALGLSLVIDHYHLQALRSRARRRRIVRANA